MGRASPSYPAHSALAVLPYSDLSGIASSSESLRVNAVIEEEYSKLTREVDMRDLQARLAAQGVSLGSD